jgi:hypothetical protein
VKSRRRVNSIDMPQPPTNSQEFIARHSQSDFRHKDELLSLLTSGDATFENNPSLVSCRDLLSIYRRRADHLQKFATPHAHQLRDDVLALCEGLATTQDENCRLWNFSSPPNSDYTVFEGAETGRILGCVLAKNKLLTPPDEWDNLWAGNKTR